MQLKITVVRDGATKKLVLTVPVRFSRWLSLRFYLRALVCCRVDYFKRSLSMQRWHLPGLRLASCGRPRHQYDDGAGTFRALLFYVNSRWHF
jgi:hypothetical protein